MNPRKFITAEPVNPNATVEARQLLEFLYRISGRYIMTGQHNTPNHLSQYNTEALQITGKYPALWGQDFGFSNDDLDNVSFRPAIIDEAIKQNKAGSVVTLMWHAVRPIENEPVTFKESICGRLTEDEWSGLVTEGTPINRKWRDQVDVVATHLGRLRDERVPVLWRPYHEMNGDWFWWGKKTGTRGYTALWRQMYDRFVNHHGLNNLLWVWNANAPAEHILTYPECFPGSDLVDVLATDVYHNDWKQSHYDDLVSLANGKPVALGEVGNLPTTSILDTQPGWTWFMVWTSFLTKANTPDAVKSVYDYHRAISRPAMAGR